MHLLRTEGRAIEDAGAAVDLGQSPGDIVVLSFSDSDLGALAAAADGRCSSFSLRLASLQQLRHPYSVDLYAERVVAHARIVLVRLLGGLDYWRYGVDEFARVARSAGVALAIVPGDGAEDPRLDEASTLPRADLRRIAAWFASGGTGNMGSLFGWIDTRLGHPCAWSEPTRIPPAGTYRPATRRAAGQDAIAYDPREQGGCANAVIVFYRSMVLAGDCAPVVALADALAGRGLNVTAFYVTSLKDGEAAALLAARLATLRPDVILNTTAFSARRDSGSSVLDEADCPVLQAVLAGASESAWRANPRGLGPADLAMNVVLPEMDGRLITAAVSAKAEAPRSAETEFTRLVHRPIPSRIAFVGELAAAWVRLRRTPASKRRLAIVLSDYPGRGGREAYAVGLDTPASVAAICEDLRATGYAIDALSPDLMRDLTRGAGDNAPTLTLAAYRAIFDVLPPGFTETVTARWGDPAEDPDLHDRLFRFRLVASGNLVVALQPNRGARIDRKGDYHDAALPPRHGYIAFYLWLRHRFGAHAVVHCGTHGTLEWTPGKPVALDEGCTPEILLGPTPLIYPFIVNNPGEAAQAKRRNAAVALGHLTPPLVEAGAHGAAVEIEALFDEYAAAETLDPKRAAIIARTLLERAAETGLAREAAVDLAEGTSALPALDAWLCDVKEMRIQDGLHVFARGGDPACARAERDGLLAALDGRFVAGGPAGAPSRGRTDVLPTGRNLYGTDPRSVPTRTAYAIGRRAADAIAERHAELHGEWPRNLVLDLWASATMRTGGEDLAQAMVHLGVRPRWDHASARVSGFDILPVAQLDRPRADVTLRISGLFRDIFPAQIALFDQAVQAVAALDEEDEWNPLAAACRAGDTDLLRIFGGAPASYGIGLGALLDEDTTTSREDLGRAYLAAGSHAFRGSAAEGVAAGAAFAGRVAAAQAYVHTRDMAEGDTLDAAATVEAEGGFAAAAAVLDVTPALYQLDASAPERPVARTQAEAIARIVRGRAANPRWVAGQMRHGHRGAAEIAETIDNLYAMAAMSDAVTSRHFDLVFAATCGADAVRAFLLEANPDAAIAIAKRFRDAAARGFWVSRRNSDAATLDDMLAPA